MVISVAVVKNDTESTPTLIRRFSKRVQGSGLIRKAKSLRYHTRTQSKTKKRSAALRRIAREEKRATMERAGLIQPREVRRGPLK